jgi:hypothetical protein
LEPVFVETAYIEFEMLALSTEAYRHVFEEPEKRVYILESEVGVPIVTQVAVKPSQPDRLAVRVTNAPEPCTYVTHPPSVVLVTPFLLFLISKVFRHVP